MTASEFVNQALRNLPEADAVSAAAVAERAANILRPAGALARLDEIAIWLAGWQRTSSPSVQRASALIFAADHGVAADGVSAYPAHLTAEMVKVFQSGRGSVNALARAARASVNVVDVGVGEPTGNLRIEPAMSDDRFIATFTAGRQAVADLMASDEGIDLLIVGEMGIGNTTPAAAVAAALYGGGAIEWVGRGTGVDDEGLARKRAVVDEAIARVAVETDPIELFRQLGGNELVAIAGAVVEARHRSIAVVLDGYVTGAAVAPLAAVDPSALDHCIAGHCSAEPGHRRLLERLGKPPILDLDMRLGEASGAMAAVPLIAAAAALVVEVPTFSEWFGE